MLSDSLATHSTTKALPIHRIEIEWVIFIALIATAALLRIAFHTGFFGSDEATYTAAAFRLLDGDWSVSTYVGANRYGVNLPVAAFAYLFGRSEFVANLYSLLCSLAEIALVFYFGRKMLGLRTAALAAAVLAFLPIHAHYAGRLMADAPLALMITASFLFFWHGETRKHTASFVVAGIAAGLSFWIKPHAIIFLFLFLTYPLIFWRWNWQWLWMLNAFIFMIVANMAFFWVTTNSPFFIFEAMQNSGYLETGFDYGSTETTPYYYLAYLFYKIYHTWLIGYFAVLALLVWWLQRHALMSRQHQALIFITWWAFGLVLIFSLFPASLEPIIFIPKQPNYMLMFVAPLALLAGYVLSYLSGMKLVFISVVLLAPSALLIAMEQTVIHVFTSNSKAAVEFAKTHRDSSIFANTNAVRAARFHNLVNPDDTGVDIRPVRELVTLDQAKQPSEPVMTSTSFVIMDTETLAWGGREAIRDLDSVPSCWVRVGTLEPTGFGLGWQVLKFLRHLIGFLPDTLQMPVSHRLADIIRPGPAYIYQVPESECGVR